MYPQKVSNLKSPVSDIALGRYFGCVIDNIGNLYSWGQNSDGQLGLGDYESRNLPTLMISLKG